MNQDVDQASILIHSPPERVASPLEVHDELIKVSDVSQTPLFSPESPAVEWAEPLELLPDGLMGHDDSSYSQKFFDLSVAQRESVVQPNGVAGDFRGKTVSGIRASIGLHPPGLGENGSS